MKSELLEKIRDGRTDLVIEFLAAGKSADSSHENGVPIIKWCAYYGDVTAIRILCEQGVALETLGENFDLNGAAFHGHWQLCQYLLEQGADPNFPLPETGETPLHNCISPNRPSTNIIVEMLLAYGADTNAKTISGAETGSFMRDARCNGERPLHRAAAFGNEHCIQMLLDNGADRALLDASGDSALSWASWHNRPGSVLALLSYDQHRILPLHIEKMQSDHGFG